MEPQTVPHEGRRPIGFAVPVSGSWALPAYQVEVARDAERLGYHSLWTFQRLLSPGPGAPEVFRSVLDPLVTLASLVHVTDTIRLGIAVFNFLFVSPALLAKQILTLDVLSGGRVDLGLGSGSSPLEYQAIPVTPDGKARRFDEFLRVLDCWLSGKATIVDGTFRTTSELRMSPPAVQRPRPPVLLGGSAPAALRRAGRYADGWIMSSRGDQREFATGIAVVREAAERAGRDPAQLRFICRVVAKLRQDSTRARPFCTGRADQIHADLDALFELGATEVFIDPNFDPEIGSPNTNPTEAVRRARDLLEACAPRQPDNHPVPSSALT